MKQISTYLAFAALLSFTPFYSTVQAQDVTIGVVNTSRIIQESPQGQEVQQQLQKEFSDRGKQLRADQKKLEEMQETMEKDAAIMSQTEREEMQRRIRRLQRNLERNREAYQEDLQYQRNQELQNVRREVVKAIQTVAKQNGYDLVLSQGVIHASNQINITEQVIDYLKETSG